MADTSLPAPKPPILPSQPVVAGSLKGNKPVPQVPAAPGAAPAVEMADIPVKPPPSTMVKKTDLPLPKPPTPVAKPIAPVVPSTSSVPLPGASAGAGTPPPKVESPQIAKPGASSKQPMFAQAGGSPIKKFLPFILIGLVVLSVVAFALSKVFGGKKTASVTSETTTPTSSSQPTTPTKQTTLTYWGLWEPEEVMQPILQEFEKANPGVLVKYVKQSPKDYRERLQTAVAAGQGPDLFRFHASWVPMLKLELSPIPSSVMSSSAFQQTFYAVANKQLQLNGQYVGIPVEYDGLVLFYNQEMLNAAGLQPPKTWAELKEAAGKLTIRDGNTLKRGGVALGNASNVEHYADVLGLLLLQNGANPADPTTRAAQDALKFYVNFVKVDKVWSAELPSSTAAFARGDAAMMLAPSWRVHDVKALNPALNFGITSAPKLADKDIAWATYWAEGVNAKSKSKDEAFKLLQFLSTKETMKKLYNQASQVRTFGEPYSRIDLASELASDKFVSPVLADAPKAQNWYLNSFTFDNGINDQIIKYYQDAINAALQGTEYDKIMATVAQGTKQVLRQYGITETTK